MREVKKEPDAAERWFRGLVQAIYSLEQFPERCPSDPGAARVHTGSFLPLMARKRGS
jgi:hypothetical protein